MLRVNKPRTLPVVLSTGLTRVLLGAVRHPVRRVALATIYALGLRLNEGLGLETGHIDAEPLLVWIRDGKGGVDRGVPLPRPLLSRLRRYWREERPACASPHLFVAQGKAAPLHHSCRNRACPRCGHDTTTRWLVRSASCSCRCRTSTSSSRCRRSCVNSSARTSERSSAPSSAPPSTPSPLSPATSNCRAAGQERYLGGQIGARAVLHTWTRKLEWHPHVHMLIPAGGLAPDGRTWRPLPRRKRRFLAPVHALGKLFRGRFLALARRALGGVPFPLIPWDKRWVVFAKPVAHGAEQVLGYLGRYVHRTAMSDRALLAMNDRSVTLR